MDTKITVLLDDNYISGLKIGNLLFFRQEKDDKVTFFNEKIVPTLLKYHNINLKEYYTKDNVTTIKESNYELTNDDIIMLSDKEKGEIAISDSFFDLEYNQKLYLTRMFQEKYNASFNYKKPETDYELLKTIIIDEINTKFQESPSKGKTIKEYFSEDIIRTLMKLYQKEDDIFNIPALIKRMNEKTSSRART